MREIERIEVNRICEGIEDFFGDARVRLAKGTTGYLDIGATSGDEGIQGMSMRMAEGGMFEVEDLEGNHVGYVFDSIVPVFNRSLYGLDGIHSGYSEDIRNRQMFETAKGYFFAGGGSDPVARYNHSARTFEDLGGNVFARVRKGVVLLPIYEEPRCNWDSTDYGRPIVGFVRLQLEGSLDSALRQVRDEAWKRAIR